MKISKHVISGKILIIISALLVVSCASGPSVKKYPLLEDNSEKGYVKFFALAGGLGGSGTSSLGGHKIELHGHKLGELFQPQYAIHSSNLSLLQPYLIVSAPPGEQLFTIILGSDETRKRITVQKDSLTIVHLASTPTGQKDYTGLMQISYFTPTSVNQANIIIPIHKDSFDIDPSMKDIDAYIGMLKDPDSGIRFYAATRLGALGDTKALNPLRIAMSKETDSSTLKEIKKAINEIE